MHVDSKTKFNDKVRINTYTPKNTSVWKTTYYTMGPNK